MKRAFALCLFLGFAGASGGCSTEAGGPSLSKPRAAPLRVGERVPKVSERDAAGAVPRAIERGTPAFKRLVRCDDPLIVFKDEEDTGADRMMMPVLRDRLERLALLVRARWPRLSLRVTEAWDEEYEHGSGSLHYEGRAADITTSDVDPDKLGELARLAVDAQFDWVYFEDASHIHVSVRR